MGPLAEPADARELIPQMYRANWAERSLSATLTSWTDHALQTRMLHAGRRHPPLEPESGSPVTEVSYQVLLGPGGKYRISHVRDGARVVEGCDGGTAWTVSQGSPGGAGLARVMREKAGPCHVLDDLQSPARLLSRFSLRVAGAEEAGGRPAWRLVARPRPLLAPGGRAGAARSAGEVRVLVDAGTGLLLRYEELFEGQPVRRSELCDVRLDPDEARDGERFRAPPGIDVPEHQSTGPTAAMPGLPGDAVRAVAGVAASALGFTVRHWPGSPEPPGGAGNRAHDGPPSGSAGVSAGASAGGGRTGPGTGGSGSGGGWTGPGTGGPLAPEPLGPASDDVINLLHRTGLAAPRVTAEVREWVDGRLLTAAISRAREALPAALAGILGPDAVWDAVNARDNGTDRTVWLRLAAPDRYRIDKADGGRPSAPDTVGCDGVRHWQVNGTRVTARPARPVPHEFAGLADPAWLLAGHRLWAGGETEVGGRRGFLVVARRNSGEVSPGLGYVWQGSLADQVEAVVDAELAVLLRLTGFIGDQPAIGYEMRGLTAGVADTSAFDVPPGAHSRGALDGLGLTPATAAKTAAGLGVAGAAALVGWLQKRPRSPGSPPS
jgi:hypothetical protein